MSDTVLGFIVVSLLAVPGALTWIYWVRRINRMSADEQQELSKRWGDGRGNGAYGLGGCGGGSA